MIRTGRATGWLQLPPEALMPWALLNEVAFQGVVPGAAVGKGGALLAGKKLPSKNEDLPLMTIPHDLILSLERVLEHAKVDKDFREVLDALGDLGRVGDDTTSPYQFFSEHTLIPASATSWATVCVRQRPQHQHVLIVAQTPRGAILTFLLVQASISCPNLSERVGVHCPFTE